MAPRLFTIPASAPFAETLARGMRERIGDEPVALADAVIYLPTRRAARTFGDAFARVLGGAALLPQFKPLGDVDDELLFDVSALELPPAIAPMRRLMLLATIVRRWGERSSPGRLNFSQDLALARELAAVMDDVETQGADIEKLDAFVPGQLSQHWERVRVFLGLLKTEWPSLLVAERRLSPAELRNRSLEALALRLEQNPPDTPIIAAGSTGSIPATARLLKVIAHLPSGGVILPGLDRDLDDASWSELDPGHPQFGMKQLLGRIGASRSEVKDWGGARASARERVLSETLRPAPTTDAWRAIIAGGKSREFANGLDGLALIEAADPAEEALAVALVLREALETTDASTALVTPDRTLARRVATELSRWGIDIDDSAGQPLAHSPPGTFMCLLAEAADQQFSPVSLLALLKHPLCTLRQRQGEFRVMVRLLDRLLRGPRPDPGLTGIEDAIAREREDADGSQQAYSSKLQFWFAEVAAVLKPLERAMSGETIVLSDTVDAHLAVASRLAGEALWSGEAGEEAAHFVDELREATAALPPVAPGVYASMFKSLAEEKAVRRTRNRHPRLFILGPLEARLQSFDVVVLSGLNEGTWPRAGAADPWFSRPMRSAIGLEQPERAIGQAAHDFSTLAAGKRVVLTRALKSEGVPTVASRWLQRLQQLARGLQVESALVPKTDYISLAHALNESGPPQRLKRPAPTPPVEARPHELSVTDIETWVRDPYAVYAKKILNLRTLDPLDAEIGPLQRGSAVHLVLERFVSCFPDKLPSDAILKLIEIADQVFAAQRTPKAVLALWRPRFAHAAAWFVEMERNRRANIERSHVEIAGRFAVTPGFTLRGRADRIDILKGGGAAILDYKTGSPPTSAQIKSFLAPQLLLEGAMLGGGGFGDLGKRRIEQLLYLHISGGKEPGEVRPVEIALINEALARLRQRIVDFSQQSTPYVPRVRPFRADIAGDYDHLSRVREWSALGWEAVEP